MEGVKTSGAATLVLLLFAAPAAAQVLTVDGTTVTLGGLHRYTRVRVVNGGRIEVPPYDGADRLGTGNLVLVAGEIFVDATSSISARGRGYQVVRCGDGGGPRPEAGGQGGCAVRDSGGGGAHFGQGGRGTKDCFLFGSATSCQFPQEFESDCGNTLNAAGTSCTSTADCRGPMASWDGEPSVAGQSFFHTIWDIEFGAAGGDKGCRDGDGFGSAPVVGGPGGGRIVLAGINAAQTGTVRIEGTLDAGGRRGCGVGNDSGGGGAGGTIVVVADALTVADGALLSAAGGLGGDTFAGAAASPDSADCPAGSQTGGTCDDCGGGGGGGLISLLSRTQTIDSGVDFDVAGAVGGTCTICQGEAGGGAGELQLNRLYVGETCDGYDNDFDGMVDEGLGTEVCGLGSCAMSQAACTAGVATACVPATSAADCSAPAVCDEPRVVVVLDTSASMLQDLDGFPTFGDGSVDHPGIDTDGDGRSNDSRLFLAKEALGQVVSAYPEIDFALARYHQDQSMDQSCQLAAWIECAGIFATYDEPGDNTGPTVCNVPIGTGTVAVRRESPGNEECINYAGSCGDPRRGADILSGFGTDTRDLVRWLDGRESAFGTGLAEGDVCAHSSGGDCELRATGPTPLAGSLHSVFDYMQPIITTDPCTACRQYSVILVTDGAESCNGDPSSAARALFDAGIAVDVVAVSVLPGEAASLNAIARAGSGGSEDAIFVSAPEDLVPTLSALVAGAIRVERCNGADDDCDSRIDEGFVGRGDTCFDEGIGACRGDGDIRCRADETGTECVITNPGDPAMVEVCNIADDDCDGAIDEGLTCSGPCTPTGAEVCNGADDDCDGVVDEEDPALGAPCGSDEGICMAGTTRCVAGELVCVGATDPRTETCNGVDDDCDGVADEMAECPGATLCVEGSCRRPCADSEFPCGSGFECVSVPDSDARVCVPTPCAVCTREQVCRDDVCVDRCEGVSCDAPAVCRAGRCVDCFELGCGSGEVCVGGVCGSHPCDGVSCADARHCSDGACVADCDSRRCGAGRRCALGVGCEDDPCADVSCMGGDICVEGSCRSPACEAGRCPRGQVCAPAVGCVADPCVVTRCAADARCVVDGRGLAECRSDGETVEPEYVWAGGSGFACAASSPGSGGPPAWPTFGLVGLVAFAIRRRR